MNKEQFGQFWEQLKTPLKAKWVKITEADLIEIKGDLDRFGTVLSSGMESFRKLRSRCGPTAATRIGRELSWI